MQRSSALTHVCIWDSRLGYRRILLDEACALFPYGVSASSGQFVCELCAQNVLLTAPGTNRRHFRHDPSSPNKECEDRQASFDPTYGNSLSALNSHTIPLRITVSESDFSFQLGFFHPPGSDIHCQTIRISGEAHQVFEYSFERIEEVGITYLNAGAVPSQDYRVEYINASSELKKYWSNHIQGVRSTGSLFDGQTGRLLPPGSKAFSERTYYLLQQRPLSSYDLRDIKIIELTRGHLSSRSIWYLYKVKVTRFSEYSAKFFFKYNIFLTEHPTKFYPIWPPYIETPNFIYHNANNFYFYLCGDDTDLRSYPASANLVVEQTGRLYKLHTREREQLVSIGKSGALGFTYLIKQQLDKEATMPTATVSELGGEVLTEDTFRKLPKSKAITIVCQFDGKTEIFQSGHITHIYAISSSKQLLLDGLSFGTEIHIFQGCDCVRIISFEKPSVSFQTDAIDRELVRKLNSCRGPLIVASHSLGTLARKLADYPQTQKWIYTRIRAGNISQAAQQLLLAYANCIKRR